MYLLYRKGTTQFLKHLIGVNRNTCNVLVMGDHGRLPLQPNWYLTSKHCKTLIKQTFLYEKRKSEERMTLENSVNELTTQYTPSEDITNMVAAPRINTLVEEKWRTKLSLFPKADTYKIFKDLPIIVKCFELAANNKHLNPQVELRVSDHQSTIETGRRHRTLLARHERLCAECGKWAPATN